MFSMFASSAVDCEFEPWSDQTKEDYKMGICCFSAKHAAVRSERNNLNQDNRSDISTC
jgi:hypothetical protein